MIVVTAKDLTSEERERLSGRVVKILREGEHTQEDILEQAGRELLERICVAGVADGVVEMPRS